MNKGLLAGIAGALIVLTTAVTIAFGSGSRPSTNIETAHATPASNETRSNPLGFTDGGTRILTFVTGLGTVFTTFTIGSGQGVDVSTIVVSNGSFSSGEPCRAGGIYISRSSSSLGLFAISGTYGTQTHNINPPIRLRPGDTVQFTFTSSGPSGEVDVTFYGRPVDDPPGSMFEVQ